MKKCTSKHFHPNAKLDLKTQKFRRFLKVAPLFTILSRLEFKYKNILSAMDIFEHFISYNSTKCTELNNALSIRSFRKHHILNSASSSTLNSSD